MKKTYDLNELEDLLVSLRAGIEVLLKRRVHVIMKENVKEVFEYVLENDPEISRYSDYIGMILDEYTEEK